MITTPTSIDIMCYVSDIIVYLYPVATTILVVQLTHCRQLTFQMIHHLQVLTDTSAMYSSPAHTYTQAAHRWLIPINVHVAGCHGTQNISPY